jgi:hypothetical protein
VPQDGAPPVRVIIYCHGNACDIGEVYLNLKQCVRLRLRVRVCAFAPLRAAQP